VTEMLHQTTFLEARGPMLYNCPNFSSQTIAGREMADLRSKWVLRYAHR
jgi:hypothetical protein